MVLGVATLTLYVPMAASLKDKRRVVKSVTERVRRRFNVAVAEVASQEDWGTITLGIVCISNDAAHANSMLGKVVRFIETERLDAELGDYSVEIL